MTPPAPCRPDLTDAPISHAASLTSDTAAAQLIAAHRTWLARVRAAVHHTDGCEPADGRDQPVKTEPCAQIAFACGRGRAAG